MINIFLLNLNIAKKRPRNNPKNKDADNSFNVIIVAPKSLGISNKIIFYKIQIPIAIRQSLPAYGNEIILMMKGTSLASTVTLMDLTGVAKYIISTTFKPIEVFIVAGGIYLFMTFIIHNLIKFLEKKYSFQ